MSGVRAFLFVDRYLHTFKKGVITYGKAAKPPLINMKDLIDRLKYLFKGQFWAFWHYKELGFTQLMYRGIPIILRDEIPNHEIWLRQKDGTWKTFNIKTRREGRLKSVANKLKKNTSKKGVKKIVKAKVVKKAKKTSKKK